PKNRERPQEGTSPNTHECACYSVAVVHHARLAAEDGVHVVTELTRDVLEATARFRSGAVTVHHRLQDAGELLDVHAMHGFALFTRELVFEATHVSQHALVVVLLVVVVVAVALFADFLDGARDHDAVTQVDDLHVAAEALSEAV